MPLNATDNEDLKTLLLCNKVKPSLPNNSNMEQTIEPSLSTNSSMDQTIEPTLSNINMDQPSINLSMDQKTKKNFFAKNFIDIWWIYIAIATILFLAALLIIIFFKNYIKKLLKK